MRRPRREDKGDVLSLRRSCATIRAADWGDRGSFTGSNLQGAARLLMHACKESGVAGVVADGVEEWVHADERHIETVTVERVLERVEGMIEFVDAKIIDADLVGRAWAA